MSAAVRAIFKHDVPGIYEIIDALLRIIFNRLAFFFLLVRWNVNCDIHPTTFDKKNI